MDHCKRLNGLNEWKVLFYVQTISIKLRNPQKTWKYLTIFMCLFVFSMFIKRHGVFH